MRYPSAVLLLFTVLAPVFVTPGCESAPEEKEPEFPPAREAMHIEILDDSFVRVDGERLARHEFVYRARVEGRKWSAQKRSWPKVFLTHRDGVPDLVRKDVLDQLRLAGVSHVQVGED